MEGILSLDIGGTKIAAAMMTRDGVSLAARRAPSQTREGPGRMIERLVGLSREVAREAGARIETTGVSCGGPLDPASGIVLSPPNLPGWDRVPLRTMLCDALGLEPAHVHL